MPRLSKIGAAALAAFGWTSGSAVSASYLVVAGGGASGGGNEVYPDGGGGGAGGLLSGTISLNPTLSYTVVVGAGGAGVPTSSAAAQGGNGSNSTFTGLTTAIGGGGGGIRSGSGTINDGLSGGSGGGAAINPGGTGSGIAGTGTVGQGNSGGTAQFGGNPYGGGGGGGAGGTGGNGSGSGGGAGGVGLQNPITGSTTGQLSGGIYYLAGGGGGAGRTGTSTGGLGGGGAGGIMTVGTPGTANTGGGAGGSDNSIAVSGVNGGSGVVIISYVGAQQFGGGVVTSSGGNTIHTFTTSGTLSPLNSLTASYLIVAGGGGAGENTGGGGGAGGLLSGSGVTIDTNSTYLVTVGSGGAGGVNGTTYRGSNGSNSSFSSVATAAVGGGGGASGWGTGGGGSTGGSGGGGSQTGAGFAGGAGTAGQGNAGGNGNQGGGNYAGGGGGGAGAAGQTAPAANAGGNGGVGIASSISGTSTYYAGGGGGGEGYSGTAGSGGLGGGGAGSTVTNGNGTSGTANTGGGGGGNGAYSASVGQFGGSGGSGIVIISYPGSTQQMAGGTVTVAGGNVIHTFTSSGYLTPIVLVNNSLRFRASNSAYLSRTFPSAGNRKTYTLSLWVKRGILGGSANQFFFSSGVSTTAGGFYFTPTDQIEVNPRVNNTNTYLTTTQVFRDPSAWYHIVFALDTTQATDSNKMKLYVNGVQVTAFSAAVYPALNGDSTLNNNIAHWIGRYPEPGFPSPFDGYLAEYNFIDGQALTPNSFGTSNGLGVWQPIRYGGSYGTNGFYLPFNQGSSTFAGSFNGSSQWLTWPANLTFGTNNFTVECWVYFTGFPNAAGGFGATLFRQDPAAGRIVDIFVEQYKLKFYSPTIGVDAFLGTETFTIGQWYHIAVVKNGNTITGYVNGTALSSPQTGNGSSIGNMAVVSTGKGDNYTQGYVSNLRVVNGTAVYTSAFVPTTSPLTNISNTNSLILQSATVIDNSSNAWTITNNGGVTMSAYSNVFANPKSLCVDNSPAQNNWTPNNISNNTNSTYDSMTDVPTLTSATAANYCVLNPLTNVGIGTVSNGNLQLVTSTNSRTMTGTMALPSTGQYYFEITATDYVTGGGTTLGIVNDAFIPTTLSNGTWLGFSTYSASYQNGTTTDTNNLTGTDVTQDGDIWCIAIDVTNNKFWIGRSRSGTLVWADGVTPAVNGSGATTISLPTGTLYPMVSRGGSYNETYNFNFGQQPFAHTPPTGFVRLNTFNLTTPTIGATAATTANKYFDISLYTGNGSTQTITNSGSMQPDFVWVKNRTNAYTHLLYDVIRGVGTLKAISSSETTAEGGMSDNATFGYLSALNSNGFTVVSGSTANSYTNSSGNNYVGWQWKANGAGSTNTAGSIISSVSANTTAGFSVVTYTGNGTTGSTVGHGLGATPSMIIVKSRSTTGNWLTYHTSTGINQYLYLNSTVSASTASPTWGVSSTTFTLQQAFSDYNTNGTTYVAYCFAQIAGYSAFGSYTGNGSSDGPFIFTGFRPRYVLIKASSRIDDWKLIDTARDPYNLSTQKLYPNLSAAENGSSGETSSTNTMDILSNGFKLRTSNSGTNENGATYIYMVFAESPFKYANAR